jgi:transcriptional regulator with XRE-family HTH domain
MDVAQRLAALRKQRGLTRQALAGRVQVQLTQINRYETGNNQPMLDVIRRLAIALTVTTDELIFGKDKRGSDDDLRLHLEAISQFDEEDKELARKLLFLKHQGKLIARARTATAKRATVRV